MSPEDPFRASGNDYKFVLYFPDYCPCLATTRNFCQDFSSYKYLGEFHVTRRQIKLASSMWRYNDSVAYNNRERSARLVFENTVRDLD